MGARNWIRRLFGRPAHSPKGPWVAEAWLEWDICPGSTLYRERFDTRENAAWAAKAWAKELDWRLPHRDDMGIKWGVRKACEFDTERAIWSPYMPGTRNYCGEHRNSHPLNQKVTRERS
jgi:hypothetical protein